MEVAVVDPAVVHPPQQDAEEHDQPPPLLRARPQGPVGGEERLLERHAVEEPHGQQVALPQDAAAAPFAEGDRHDRREAARGRRRRDAPFPPRLGTAQVRLQPLAQVRVPVYLHHDRDLVGIAGEGGAEDDPCGGLLDHLAGARPEEPARAGGSVGDEERGERRVHLPADAARILDRHNVGHGADS